MRECTKKAQKKYDKKTRKFNLRFNPDNDSDVISALETQDNITDYIRSLIRADIKNCNK